MFGHSFTGLLRPQSGQVKHSTRRLAIHSLSLCTGFAPPHANIKTGQIMDQAHCDWVHEISLSAGGRSGWVCRTRHSLPPMAPGIVGGEPDRMNQPRLWRGKRPCRLFGPGPSGTPRAHTRRSAISLRPIDQIWSAVGGEARRTSRRLAILQSNRTARTTRRAIIPTQTAKARPAPSALSPHSKIANPGRRRFDSLRSMKRRCAPHTREPPTLKIRFNQTPGN